MFIAKPVREEMFYGKQGVIVNVSGKGRYLGEGEYWLEENDELGKGFLLR